MRIQSLFACLLLTLSFLGSAASLPADGSAYGITLNRQDSKRLDCFVEIIQKTGLSIIYIGAPYREATMIKMNYSGKLPGALDLLCSKDLSWKIVDDVIVIQKKGFSFPMLTHSMPPELFIQQNFTIAQAVALLENQILPAGIIARRLNFEIKPLSEPETFLAYLIRLVKGTNTMTHLYEIPNQEAVKLDKIYQEHHLNYPHFSQRTLYGLIISENYESLIAAFPFQGEDVLDGNKLLSCRLSLLDDQRFSVTLKNLSSQVLSLKDFKQGDLLLNDLASTGKFFEVNEIATYFVYPPEKADLPDEFQLAPGEERTFVFPLQGCRSRRNRDRQIWEIGFEKKYPYRPGKDIEVLQRRNRGYNLYGIVVYFYGPDGKKYKSWNRSFIDSTGWPEPQNQ